MENVYRGVPLPGQADNLGDVFELFEREKRRDDFERRHSQLAKVYPTLFAGVDETASQTADAAYTAAATQHEGAGLGAHNLFRKEFGHLSEASQHKFKADSLWMGQAESVLRFARRLSISGHNTDLHFLYRPDEATQLRSQLRNGLSKGLNIKVCRSFV